MDLSNYASEVYLINFAKDEAAGSLKLDKEQPIYRVTASFSKGASHLVFQQIKKQLRKAFYTPRQ